MIKILEGNQNSPDDMILIPAGAFLMGSTKQDIEKLLALDQHIEVERLNNEIPQREVYLNAYYIDKYPVTNAKYKIFIESGGYTQQVYWSDAGWNYIMESKPLENNELDDVLNGEPDCPTVNVSWYEVEAFSKWSRKRLPTEAEWEKAARGKEDRKSTRLNSSHSQIS